MPALVPIPTQSVVPGQLISAVLWNGEFQNIFNNFIPASIDDASGTVDQMRSMVDPFPASVLSSPTALIGELERLRFTVNGIKGTTYWYEPPAKTIPQLVSSIETHRHTGTTDGTQIPVGGLANDAVETAKIKDLNVTTAKIALEAVTAAKLGSDSVTTDKIVAGAVTLIKLNSDAKFAAGTRLFFANDAAPIGWSLVTSNNDKALRVVSSAGLGGSAGGSVPFSTGIALQHTHVVNSHTHGITSESAHSHSISSDGSHNHSWPTGGGEFDFATGGGENDSSTATSTNGSHSHGGATGSAGGHSHGGATGASSPSTDSKLADFAGYQYVNVICCEKS